MRKQPLRLSQECIPGRIAELDEGLPKLDCASRLLSSLSIAVPESSLKSIGIVLLSLVALCLSWVGYDYWQAVPDDVVATYVGRQSCIECHREQAQLYDGSHHDLAMDLATDQTVLGDFSDVTFEHDGLVNRLYRDGKKFMIDTEGPTGKIEPFEIKYVFGVTPLQQYMVEFDRNERTLPGELPRLQVLRISWDTINRRWFYLRPPDVADKLEPDDPLHWTGIAQRWQTMCADCHSTNLRTGYDVQTASYHTTFSEIDVSCEACHGPGSVHNQLASSNRLFWDRKRGYGLVPLKSTNPEVELQTCAACHSRRAVIATGCTGGETYHDHFQLEMLGADTYFDDGQIKDEVYEFGSFVQSKMYHKQIRCTDCHDPHSLKLKHPGNQTCTSCHQHPAGKYDVPAHHRHAVGSEGAKCVNCHMPGRTYMELDFRRDHSLRIPRPDLSVEFGTPNACTGCHLSDQLAKVPESQRSSLVDYEDWQQAAARGDKRIAELLAELDRWSSEACEKWYGPAKGRLTEPAWLPVAEFRRGDETGVQRLVELAKRNDELTPAITRATAFEELANVDSEPAREVAANVIADLDEPAHVRSAAIGCMARADAATVRRALLPLIKDPKRQVRLEAVQELVNPNVYNTLSNNERTQVDVALGEVQQTLQITADRSGSHMAWALLSEQRGLIPEAIKAYEQAMRVEPNVTGPRTNLAAILEQVATEHRDEEAAKRAAELRAQELPLLRRDSTLALENAAVQYRYGLALYLAGDYTGALAQLQLAVKLEPNNQDYAVALQLLEQRLQELNGK